MVSVLVRVAVLVAVTLAPTITAPLGSVTLPVIVPRSVWAQMSPAVPKTQRDRTRIHMSASFPVWHVLRVLRAFAVKVQPRIHREAAKISRRKILSCQERILGLV